MQVTNVRMTLSLGKGGDSGPAPEVVLRQGDALSTRVVATVLVDGAETDLGGREARLVGTRPDGLYMEQEMEVEGGTAMCLLDGAWAGAAGDYRCAYVAVRDGDDEAGSTRNVSIRVLRGADEQAAPGDPYVGRFEEAIGDAMAAERLAIEAAQKAEDERGELVAALDSCEDFLNGFEVQWENLSPECRANIAASAAAGADVATAEDMEAAWKQLVSPAVAGGSPGELSEEEVAWVLSQVLAGEEI